MCFLTDIALTVILKCERIMEKRRGNQMFFNRTTKKELTAVFIDYEHVFYSIKNLYHKRPDILSWKETILKDYPSAMIWYAFADFSYPDISHDMEKLEQAEIQTFNSREGTGIHRKGGTELAMIESIYQTVLKYPKIGTIILFAANRHLTKTVKFLKEELHKRIVLWSVTGAGNEELDTFSESHRSFPWDNQLEILYPLITENLRNAEKNPSLIPTFSGTVNSVAQGNGLPRQMIQSALLQMITSGMVKQYYRSYDNRKPKRILSLP